MRGDGAWKRPLDRRPFLAPLRLWKVQDQCFPGQSSGHIQRECIRCTDDLMCNSCKHTEVASDACVSRQISHLADTRPDMDKDQRIAVAISKCEVTNKDETWRLYKKFEHFKD